MRRYLPRLSLLLKVERNNTIGRCIVEFSQVFDDVAGNFHRRYFVTFFDTYLRFSVAHAGGNLVDLDAQTRENVADIREFFVLVGIETFSKGLHATDEFSLDRCGHGNSLLVAAYDDVIAFGRAQYFTRFGKIAQSGDGVRMVVVVVGHFSRRFVSNRFGPHEMDVAAVALVGRYDLYVQIWVSVVLKIYSAAVLFANVFGLRLDVHHVEPDVQSVSIGYFVNVFTQLARLDLAGIEEYIFAVSLLVANFLLREDKVSFHVGVSEVFDEIPEAISVGEFSQKINVVIVYCIVHTFLKRKTHIL